jgi:hypothetical protein
MAGGVLLFTYALRRRGYRCIGERNEYIMETLDALEEDGLGLKQATQLQHQLQNTYFGSSP